MAKEYYLHYEIEERNDIIREIMGKRVLSIPSLHYQAGDSSLGVLDSIGSALVGLGLENVPSSRSTKRWYGAEDSISGISGSPIITVNTYENSEPSYLNVRKDGTNETIKLDGKVVTADLRAENAFDNPSFVMITGLPLYEKVKLRLFELSHDIPFIDDESYRDYIKEFSEVDHWLKLKKTELRLR